jgi:hypothetical protein
MKQMVMMMIEVEMVVSTILIVDIWITSRVVDLAAEALVEDVVTSVADVDSVVNFEAEVEVMTIVLVVATYEEVIYIEVTLRAEGLVMDMAATIYINSLESIISVIRKAASLYNTF